MEYKCNIELEGDLIDSLQLTSVLDEIMDSGATCKIREIKVNEEKIGNSYVRMNISADNEEKLDILVDNIINKHNGKIVDIITKTIEIKGHILDSLTLAKILDIIFKNEGKCEIKDVKVGLSREDFSYAKIDISALNTKMMENIIEKVTKQGAIVLE